MKLKLIFLSISFSTILFGQTDSVAKKEKYKDNWQKINERQDTDSANINHKGFNFTPIKETQMQTDWGLSRISDTMLIEQTEILVREWLEFVYYQNIKDYTSLYVSPLNEFIGIHAIKNIENIS